MNLLHRSFLFTFFIVFTKCKQEQFCKQDSYDGDGLLAWILLFGFSFIACSGISVFIKENSFFLLQFDWKVSFCSLYYLRSHSVNIGENVYVQDNRQD